MRVDCVGVRVRWRMYGVGVLGYAKIFGLIREMACLACIGMLKLTMKNLLKLTHRKMCHRVVQIRPT